MARSPSYPYAAADRGCVVEFTRFRLPGPTTSVLEGRRAWSDEWRAESAYQGGLLVAIDGDEWLEINLWQEQAAPTEAFADGGKPVGLVDLIAEPFAEILGQESGALAYADAIAAHDSGPSLISTGGRRL